MPARKECAYEVEAGEMVLIVEPKSAFQNSFTRFMGPELVMMPVDQECCESSKAIQPRSSGEFFRSSASSTEKRGPDDIQRPFCGPCCS